ncbi:hypothetical protein [Paenibacillus barengoltzii]|uniref:Uncharacterized protein n=1 Tax=Paenibacillus barengoltzii G22 TaxID=1235795 RepID=R9LPL1_9BACL|nr:hypothetical protein [Paenibacillus barengoltzii]EOS57662.1 hypothetical protein C812_00707 [Paenibacillus barengoltzii G22]
MARDDNDKLEVEIDDRDIDRTAKKLRNLDKLLQQTHRRAALLGKSRIKPALTLDDRFTSAAQKVEDTLRRLHRTTVQPTVNFSDRVTGDALKLRAYLTALTVTPWQVSAAGVDWEAVVGDSFTDWISSEGKSTLKRISAAIGNALVITGKLANSVLNPGSHGMSKENSPVPEQPERKGFLEKTVGSLFEFTNTVRKDVAKDYTKEGTKELMDKYILKKDEKDKKITVECKCRVTCYCNCGAGGGGYISGTGPGRKRTGRAARGARTRSTVVTQVQLPKPKPSSGGGLKGSLKKIGVGLLLSTGGDLLAGSGLPELITKGAGKVDQFGAKLLGKAGGLIGKIGKGIKLPGPLGLLSNASAIASADNNKDRLKATTSAVVSSIGGLIGGALGSIIPFAGTAVGATLGSMGGDFLGNHLGGWIYNLYSKKKEPADKKATPKPDSLSVKDTLGLSAIPQMAPSLAGINPYAGNVSRQQDDAQKKASPPSQINVSLSQGAINLTVNKDEINYDELAKAAGWKIANEVRFAMQNLK